MKEEKDRKGNSTSEEGALPDPGKRTISTEARIRKEYRPLGKKLDTLNSAEALLRVPGRILFEMRNGNGVTLAYSLAIVAVVCLMAYGLTVGMFSWGTQLWAAPLKVTLGALFSALICFPSLVVFSFLAGSDTTIREIFLLLVATLALSSLLLLGFGPVSWIFTQSTESVAFMGALHLLFWLIGIYYGTRFLGAATGFLHGEKGRHIAVWSGVFLLVSLQMMTTLRPIVGTDDALFQADKKFFMTHWIETVEISGAQRTR
jgi:hypothetical protein